MENENIVTLPLIDDKAPSFRAKSTQGKHRIDRSFRGRTQFPRTIKDIIEYKGMKNVEVKLPLIEDISMDVAKNSA